MKAIMEIRAGEGGNDSKLFVKDMFRMYSRYSRSHGIKTELLNTTESEFTLSLEGPIEDLLKFECGVHRIQRVPPTESRGRRHSSTITVAILPAPAGQRGIDLREIEFKTFKGTGPGGQHKNKVETGVKAIHKPSGMVASCSKGRSQWQNKRSAISVLLARLLRAQEEKELEKTVEDRRKQIGKSGRAEKIRTYNLIHGRVKDARLKKALYCVDKILDGELDLLYSKIKD